MERHHYVGLEHHVRVLENVLELKIVQGYTIVNADSPRLLSNSELNGLYQINPELTPFSDLKWVKLSGEEYQSFLEAKKQGEESFFLEALLADPSRIVASKQHSNPNHQHYALVEEKLKKKKRKEKITSS